MKINRQLISLIACAALLPAWGATADPTVAPTDTAGKTLPLSREECLRIALSDNPTVRVSDMDIERVNYSKKETLASLFPTIDFSMAYQRTIELQTVSMNMGGQTQSFKMGQENTWNMGFSASVPLIAPQLWKSLSISDNQILQSLESARASRLDLINEVNKAYYTLMLARSSHEVVKQNYDRAKFNADLFEKQFAAGTATEYDVLRSQVQVKNVEPELLQGEIAIRQAQLQLAVLMGLDAAVRVTPTVELADLQQEMYGYLLDNKRDLTDNTQLRTLDLQTDALKKTVELRKLAWIPTLGASFNYTWLSMGNGNAFKNVHFNPYSTVGLQLSVPIFSGGSKYYSLKQAKVQLNEMALQRENLVNTLNMQVDIALENIDREAAQISTSKAGVEQAEKAYTIMQKSFEIGAATYLDLRDAELASTSAQLAYYQAIYNYLVSSSELDLLVGKEDSLTKFGNDPVADYKLKKNK